MNTITPMRRFSFRFSIRSLLIAFVLVALGIVFWPAIWKQFAVYSVVRNVDRKEADYVRPAAEALVGHGKKSIPVFAELLKHDDMYVRIVAAEKLGDLGPAAESVDALIAALHDNEFRVRMSAVNVFWKLGKSAEPAIPEIVACLADNESQVQAFAVQSLGRLAEKGVNTVMAVHGLTELSKEPVFESGKSLEMACQSSEREELPINVRRWNGSMHGNPNRFSASVHGSDYHSWHG